VLVVGLGALLLTTGVLFLTSAEVAAAGAAAGTAQSRSLQWSGLQAVMAVLGQQRERVLRGERPRLDSQYVIYEHGPRAGVVRLLPLCADGEALDSEAGKIDVNRADAAALIRTGQFDEETAARIIAFRDAAPARPIVTLSELLGVRGASLEDLYGRLDEVAMLDDWSMGAAARAGARRGIEPASPRSWADILTVHAVEPSARITGEARLCVSEPWSKEMEQAMSAALDQSLTALMKAVLESGAKFETEGSIIAALVPLQVPPAEWMAVVDALTSEPGGYHLGRLDINSASHEALMSLPGMEPEQAARIVQERRSLSAAERGSVLWPVSRGIIPVGQLQALAGRITTRSLCWRVRLACGEVDAVNIEGELIAPTIVEAVIDLCDPQPRLAYLRDLGMFETALALASLEPEEREAIGDERDETPLTAEDGEEPSLADGAAAPEPPDAGAMNAEGGDVGDVADPPADEPAAAVDGDDASGSLSSGIGAATPGGSGRLGRWLPPGG